MAHSNHDSLAAVRTANQVATRVEGSVISICRNRHPDGPKGLDAADLHIGGFGQALLPEIVRLSTQGEVSRQRPAPE